MVICNRRKRATMKLCITRVVIAGFIIVFGLPTVYAASVDKENRAHANAGARSKPITKDDMALSEAAFRGNLKVVKEYLTKGANPNMPVGTYTIFQEALELAFPMDQKTSKIMSFRPSFVEVLKELAKHGGNIQDLHLDDYYAHYFDKSGVPVRDRFASDDVARTFKEALDYLRAKKTIEAKPRPQL